MPKRFPRVGLTTALVGLFLPLVWRAYAERYLAPDQGDVVDLEALLARLRG